MAKILPENSYTVYLVSALFETLYSIAIDLDTRWEIQKMNLD